MKRTFFWAIEAQKEAVTTTYFLGFFHVWWINGAMTRFYRKRFINPRDWWPYIALNFD